MIFGAWVPRAVQIAAELGIADLLDDGPRDVAQLAAATETHAPSLYRLLRALASVNVFTEIEPACFAQSEHSAWLVASRPGSLRDIARMIGAEYQWGSYAALSHSIKTGEPAFDHVYGVSAWEYLAEIDPAAGRVFDAAMNNMSAQASEHIARDYDFSSFRTVADVGGGRGSTLAAVLARYPGLRGLLLDRPPVVAEAKELLRAAGVGDRCRVVPGDFMSDAVPGGAEAYILARVLHSWRDKDALAILRNCRQAIPAHGRLLIIDQVLPAPPAKLPWRAAGSDLLMLKNHGAGERTEQEFQTLLGAAGFSLTRIVPTAPPTSILDARPR